jgi:hypothetical protein
VVLLLSLFCLPFCFLVSTWFLGCLDDVQTMIEQREEKRANGRVIKTKREKRKREGGEKINQLHIIFIPLKSTPIGV